MGQIEHAWPLAPEGGAALVKGTDFGGVQAGRLHGMTGFFDPRPSAGRTQAGRAGRSVPPSLSSAP